MNKSIGDKFLLLKSLCNAFSTSAKPIGGGFSSLVVDMGDGTISKFYQPNIYGAEQNKQHLLNETRILKAFNGHVGDFYTPVLTGDSVIFEDDSAIANHFVGYVPMTKLEGRTIEWNSLNRDTNHQQFTSYLHQAGSLIASIHDTAVKSNLNFPTELSTNQIYVPWVTDPEITHMIDVCNQWFGRHQTSGFIHADFSGRNITIDKNNRIQGVLDFSFSGVHSNHMNDFNDLVGNRLSPAIEGYEKTSGKTLDVALIHMTQIQGLGSYISTLIDSVGQERELSERKIDFEKWVREITKDLALQ